MKKNTIKAVAAALAIAGLGFAAVASTGDIYEFVPVEGSCTPSTACVAGQKVQFKIRLVARDWATNPTPSQWYIAHIGPGSQILDDLYNPLKVGVVVSGRMKFASIVGQPTKASSDNSLYWDVLCEYVAEPGDFAMPMNIALDGSTETAPIVSGNSDLDVEFFLLNKDLWSIKNDAGDAVRLTYMPNRTAVWEKGIPPSGYDPNPLDYTLDTMKFFLKTVDFDDNWDTADKSAWRIVYQNTSTKTATKLYAPTLAMSTAPTNSVTLYVWSKDDTSVRMDDGEDVVMVDPDDTDQTITRKVKAITLETGVVRYPFDLYGVAKDTSTELVLSPTKGFVKNSSGTLVSNFVTRVVSCDAEPAPFMTVTDESGSTTVEMQATTNYTTGVKMVLTFSKPFTNDVTVCLNPTNMPSIDPLAERYLSLLQSDNDPATTPPTNCVTMKEGETRTTFWIYALGTCEDIRATGITLTPKAVEPDAQDFFRDGTANQKNGLVRITRDQAPSVEVAAPSTGFAQDSIDVSVQVTDNWRDTSTYNTNGYTVTITLGTTTFTTNTVLFRANTPITFPVTIPSEGNLRGTVEAKDPMGNRGTATFTIEAAPPLTVTPRLFESEATDAAYDMRGLFTEGEALVLRCELTSEAQQDMYAFLVPVDAQSSNLVSTVALTNGLFIGMGSTRSDYAVLTLKDGDAWSEHRTKANFTVVLKDKQDFNDTAANTITTYASRRLPTPITIENVPPAVVMAYRYDGETNVDGSVSLKTSTAIRDGATVRDIPAEIEIPFSVQMTDLGVLDLADTNHPIQVIWTWTDSEDQDELPPQYVDVDTNGISTLLIPFYTYDSVQVVRIYATDRDMQAAGVDPRLGEPIYTFNVAVGDPPTIYIESPHVDEEGNFIMNFDENLDGEYDGNYLIVKLSEYPNAKDRPAGEPAYGTASHPLRVQVTITKRPTDGGVLEFVTNIVEFTSARDNVDGVIVEFDKARQNGGKKSPSQFTVKAELLDDGYHKKDGTKWSKYFLPMTEKVGIVNVAPTLSLDMLTPGKTLGITNEWSVGEEITLQWTANDIAWDLTNGNFKVTWSGITSIDGKSGVTIPKTTALAVDDPLEASVTNSMTFAVPNRELTEVRFIAYDDNGESEPEERVSRTLFWIKVTPSKPLAVKTVGPAGASKSKYAAQALGLGRGIVYAIGAGTSTGLQFDQTFQYPEGAQDATIYAAGYPAAVKPACDSGTVWKAVHTYTSMPLDTYGNKYDSSTSSGYYDYSGRYDNYFYRWANIAEGSATLLDPEPTPRPWKLSKYVVALDSKGGEGTAGGYKTTQVEAIFSQEYYETDNMGDINADAIPDLYVAKYWPNDTDDLADKRGSNDDDDWLPNNDTGYWAGFIPSLPGDWASEGSPFSAELEIRGYGAGLNDATAETTLDGIRNMGAIRDAVIERRYVDPAVDKTSTLSPIEYLAWKAYAEENGLDVAKTNDWAKWSPERPTNPTKVDTDEDGFPDGYEYYFWYRAHVGYLEGTNLVKLTGLAYNPTDPLYPTPISSDTIKQLMDPIVRGDSSSETRDTDNDGLPDMLELSLGTNPFMWDTDGDGLPDGYETMIGYDPRKPATDNKLGDGERNDDQDVMAEAKIEKVNLWSLVDTGGVTNWYWSADNAAVDPADVVAGTVVPERFFGVMEYAVRGKFVRTREYAGNGHASVLSNQTAGATLSKTNLYVIHCDAYLQKGFDPRVAWGLTDKTADSRAFTLRDEFLLMAWACRQGLPNMNIVPSVKVRPWTQIWSEYCTSDISADCDGDGVPDGWELYVMSGPRKYDKDSKRPIIDYGYSGLLSPLRDDAGDPAVERSLDNSLLPVEEFSSVESCAWNDAHSKCATILNLFPAWTNKLWPTDPWNADSDDDGVPDATERDSFAYGEPTGPGAGGGLDPNSWDTDGDLLPDPWELEFAGHLVAGEATTKTETTVDEATGATNTVTTTVREAGKWEGGMDGTVKDAEDDYDHDGLLNWQEYMVGAMRCWRYDDPVSRWDFHDYPNVPNEADPTWHTFWYATLMDEQDRTGFNPHLAYDLFDLGIYFSRCTNAWDKAEGKYFMFYDGVYHDLARPPAKYKVDDKLTLNRFTWKPYFQIGNFPMGPYVVVQDNKPICPTHYICCNPTKPDTDCDGMDDYYELFHGMNPLLGSSGVREKDVPYDVVHEAYGIPADRGGINALNNWWIPGGGAGIEGTVKAEPRIKPGSESSIYDFEQYPWLSGLAAADPDGDNVRNQLEAIMPSVQAASSFLHTDPTPLWITDTGYTGSIPRRYYRSGGETVSWFFFSQTGGFLDPDGKWHYFTEFPGWTWDEKTGEVRFNRYTINNWNVDDYIFSFEENEGYDTDSDYLGDEEEARGRTKPASDPQDSDSPLRRQAMWFGGADNPSFLETPIAVEEAIPENGTGSELRQDFLYYTVECWAKPDEATYAQKGLQTLVERAVYTGEAGPADSKYLRKNFLIGIKDGRWYTKFDSAGTDVKSPVEILNGPVATTAWTHIAASYDGSTLTLYVNGTACATVNTSIKPECGTAALAIASEEGGAASGREYYTTSAIIVGASAANMFGVIFDYLWRFPISERPTTFADYDSYYKGYIDEVRIWDGARSASDILADYTDRVRYTVDLVRANRSAVFSKWATGVARAPQPNVSEELPPELKCHWTFDHVPGAVLPTDLMKVPAGFSTAATVADAKAIWVRPEGWASPWWKSVCDGLDPTRQSVATGVGSLVFTDMAWEPWIINTVAHLDREDGSTLDSIFWCKDYAGLTSAAELGYTGFAFPRTHEPYTRWTQVLYYGSSVSVDSSAERANANSTQLLYAFARRGRNRMGDDLLPMGGAYPRRISASEGGMWDDDPETPSASDAWAQTGIDADNNGLPDWWESYARVHYGKNLGKGVKINWDTILDYEGVPMSAGQAYLRDLARGIVRVDGTKIELLADYADLRDLDHDNIADWWEDIYGIDTGSASDALADPDRDGLSNYQEYLIAQIDGILAVNPILAKTFDGQDVTDYFLKTPSGEYLGEAYADHDFMEDDLEPELGTDRTKYDAYSDNDGDGWTAFSELRYSTFKMTRATRFVSHVIGGEEVKDFPIPVIHATLRYNGNQVLSGSNSAIVVEAYSGNNLQKAPNAVYRVVPGSAETRSRNLGTYEERVMRGTLSPGHVVTGEDKMKLKFFFVQDDTTFSWVVNNEPYTGTYAEMVSAMLTYGSDFSLSSHESGWNDITVGTVLSYTDGAQMIIQVAANENTQKGKLLIAGKEAGKIDLLTGDFEIDLSTIGPYYMAGSRIRLSQCFFGLEYATQLPTLQAKALTVSLEEPDRGNLTEGQTAFVAYMDLDGSGDYTPGEPIGFAKNVQVGWDQVPELTIEMTDESVAAGKRFAYDEGFETLRVIRTEFNGREFVDEAGKVPVKRRIVYSRDAATATRNTVFEGDLVSLPTAASAGKYGIDWANLRADILASGLALKDVSDVTYLVTKDTVSVEHIAEGDVIDRFTVAFPVQQTKPIAVSPSATAGGIVETQRPTFRWSGAEGNTCFAVVIRDAAGAEVWSNTNTLAVLPPRDTSGNYVWTAPVFIGHDTCGDAWMLENGSNYTWEVAMFNAKFSSLEDAVWSDPAGFRTALAEKNDLSTVYGSAKVSVSYFGPATNELSKVVVQLFRTADLTGTPVAQARLSDVAGTAQDLTNAHTVAFSGLESGDYYAAAYIDRNGDNARQRYETWGYSAQVGKGLAAIWTPLAVRVDAGDTKIRMAEIFMEDTDVNQDDVPDCNQDESLLVAVGATAEDDASRDDDGDGLTADEEANDTYTDKSKWDTDGDGMPDGWEARFANLDPLTPDADEVVDGDVMAYVVTNLTVFSTWDGVNPSSATNMYAVVGDTQVKAGDDASTLANLRTIYDYNGQYGLGKSATASGRVYNVSEDAEVVLVHAQVYKFFGFDPNTANPAAVKQDGSNTVYGVNTKAFTAIDKYLVCRYLEQAYGLSSEANEVAMNTNKAWAAYTLKPGDPDNNRDGVPDGWELYMMFGTNDTVSALANAKVSPFRTGVAGADYVRDPANTPDQGGLKILEEYDAGRMPSDPWVANSLYKYLYERGLLLIGTTEFTDAEAHRFALDEDTMADDDDNDVIANLQEIQAYYYDRTALADLDPEKAWSDGATPDYFRKARSTYLGLLFNGGEFIEPSLRKAMGIGTLVSTGTRDYRVSGWDAWSTARYSILNAEQTVNIEGVVSDELMLLIRYWNVVRPGEFTGTTVADAMDFFHEIWKGVIRLIDYDGNVVIETTEQHDIGGYGTIHHADAAQTTTQVVAFFGGQAKMEETIMRNKKDITADQIVTPEPTINLVLKYAGNGSYNLVLEAYQVDPAYPEYGEQLSAQWTTPVKFDAGVAKVNEIRTPGLGSLKQGLTRFVAYIDANGDGEFSAGDTSGETKAEVGYLGCDLAITLGEANPALPSLRLYDGTNVVSTLALVRSAINGKPLFNSAKGVYIVQFPNNAAREALYPGEYDTGSYIGIDSTLASLENVDEIESVTYEVLRLREDEVATLSVTNLNNYILVTAVETNGETVVTSNVVTRSVNETVTFNYSLDRDVAQSIACAGSTADDFTLTFTVPTDTMNTKFWLNVQTNDATGTLLPATLLGGDKGFILNDIRDGVVVLDKYWFADKKITIPTGTVKFGVVLGNDKFGRPQAVNCAMAEAIINEGASFDGRLAVQVKHPTAALGAKLTIAAYDKADLANPVAQTNNCALGKVVELGGLRPGASYYVAAWYVKDKDDGRAVPSDPAWAYRRMPYDTWGYLCKIDVTNTTQIAANLAFDPVAVVAGEAPRFAVTTNTIWLQDTDWNDNNVADRKEDFRAINGDYAHARKVEPQYGFEIAGVDETDLFSDAMENDVFAYAEVPFYCVMVEIGGVETWFAVKDLDKETVVDRVGSGIPNGTSLKDLTTLATTYFYDFGKSNAKRLALGTNVVWTGSEKVVKAAAQKALILVHGQVYDEFGFNPNTANGRIDKSAWVNTRAFTSVDKNYVTNYLANVLGEVNVAAKALPYKYPDADQVANGRGDGILDGWELYVKHDPWVFIDRAFDADKDGLDLLHEYDGGFEPTDPWDPDTDGDGVQDKYANEYNLKGGHAGDDDDRDGLSNYAEYLITEVFKFAASNPKNPKTNDGVADAYMKVGNLYLGELFTDHDQMDDVIEDAFGGGLSRYVYDAHLDSDDDGWSNYAELRAFAASDLVDVSSVVTNALTGAVVTNVASVRAYAGHPTPTIELALTYDGSVFKTDDDAGSNVVLCVEAYSAGLSAPDAVWQVALSANDVARGNTTVQLGRPTKGYVREGMNTLVCYMAGDDARFVPGSPYGTVANVDVGWHGTKASLALTKTNPVFARVDLYDGGDDRVNLFGADSGDIAWSTIVTNKDVSVDRLESSEHVRIVPYMVAGVNQDTALHDREFVQLVKLVPNRVVAEFDVDPVNKRTLTEADFLRDGKFDIDWDDFYTVICLNSSVMDAVGDVTAVKYRIVLGRDGPVGPESNLDTTSSARAYGTLVERRYEPTASRTLPTQLLTEGIVHGARPTFSWRLDEPVGVSGYAASSARYGCTYTAFQIQVKDESGTVVYDSGVQRAPVRSASGVFTWTAPLCVGDLTAEKKVFLPTGDWTWRVAMYNAKFKPTTIAAINGWSAYAQFSTAVGLQQEVNDSGYGQINVAVRYAGPAKVLEKCGDTTQLRGIVRVQAFDTPDFSGDPLAATIATDAAVLADTLDISSTVALAGLKMGGTYYVRAFIDSNGNGIKDYWESWGCVNFIGEEDVEAYYAPKGISLDTSLVKAPTVGLFIEDADTDQDWLPDAWEYAEAGWTGDWAAVKDQQKAAVDGTVAIDTTGFGTANISTGLPGATLTVFENGSFAELMLGVKSSGLTFEDIRAAIDKNVQPTTVKILALTLDTGAKQVVLTLDADVALSIAGQLVSQVYGIQPSGDATVTVKVYKKATLMDANWQLVSTKAGVKIGAHQPYVTVPLDATLDLSSGFFKVEVE